MAKNKDDILQALNPADTFTLAMDEEIRQEGMPGSLCGFALELSGSPNIEALETRIKTFIKYFPVTQSSIQQRGKRFYWCRRDNPRQFFFQHFSPAKKNETEYFQQTIEKILNTQESREQQSPVEFHILTGTSQSVFLLRWIHPFCDARGAELILKFLMTDDPNQLKKFTAPSGKPLVNQQLDKYKWWQKIGLFLKAKRHIESIDQYQSIIPLNQKQLQQQPEKLRYAVFRISEQQTAIINKIARKQAGLTGTSLYFLGCMMRTLEKINPDFPGEAYCVPYAFNLRKSKVLTPVLGNHVCALFSQARREQVQDRSKLFQHLKQQNAKVIREKMDYAFLPLMWAASWLSLEKYGKTLRHSYKTGTERTSFWFSDIGPMNFNCSHFFDAEIQELFHLCQISSPPALGLLSCQFQGKLSLTYNFIDPYFNHQWIEQLHDFYLEELLTE
jgi:hypothetical protein